jgi:hypothetical protein
VPRRRQHQETFAETLAEVRRTPPKPQEVPSGRRGGHWGDPDGRRYELVNHKLRPQDAVQLARLGARIVYDVCGCGGDGCELDWLSDADARQLGESGLPRLHPRKHGLAELQHWRSADGRDLIVAAVEISWGDRIRG